MTLDMLIPIKIIAVLNSKIPSSHTCTMSCIHIMFIIDHLQTEVHVAQLLSFKTKL